VVADWVGETESVLVAAKDNSRVEMMADMLDTLKVELLVLAKVAMLVVMWAISTESLMAVKLVVAEVAKKAFDRVED